MRLLERFRRRGTSSAATAPADRLPVEPRSLTVGTGACPAAEMALDDLAFCVVDVETTGLAPGQDRVVEIAVVRCDAHGDTVDEWHTLVHPQRPVFGTWIHGIDDDMVADAPCFDDIAPRLLSSLDAAVLVAHNAAFDRGFLQAELAGAGIDVRLPYLCTMHMRRHVGHTAPVMHRLAWACWQTGAPLEQAHAAVADARAVATLLRTYLVDARTMGHGTLRSLAATAAVADACSSPLLSCTERGTTGLVKPRPTTTNVRSAPRHVAEPVEIARYKSALEDAVEDFALDGDEVDALHALVIDLGMSARDIRDAHREFISERLVSYLDDDELSWEEYEQLRILSRLLAVDGRWLEELVAEVRPRYAAATVEALEDREGASDGAALEAPISVCFTGPFEAMPLTRGEVEALAADAGMHVRSGVSAKLDLLVCFDPYAGTSKLNKAESRGTVVIDQESFLAVAGVATPEPSPTPAILNAIAARRRTSGRPRAGSTSSPKASRSSASTRPATSNGQRTQLLWCESGRHEWSRPAQRGRPPRRCPQH